MTYALQSTELFVPAAKVSPYTPAQQKALAFYHRGISAEPFKDGLFGLRRVDQTRLISIPYLREFVKYSLPITPAPEALQEFAQTQKALCAAQETVDKFAELQQHYIAKGMAQENKLTIGQAAAILRVDRKQFQALVDMTDVSLEPAPWKGQRNVPQLAATDLGQLFTWHYPSGLRAELLNTEVPFNKATTTEA